MGLLGRLFGGGDPLKDLDKARSSLERDPARAMTLARKLLDSHVAEQAKGLVDEARARLFDNAMVLAEEAEASEYFEDAAEWLDRALEQLADEGRRPELEARRQRLIEQAEAADEEPWEEPSADDGVDPADFEGGGSASVHVDALIDSMSEPVAERYRAQGAEFRQALGQLLDGELEAAAATFDALCEREANDGVVHLERGRVRTILGDMEGARDDFAIAWDDLGPDPLFDGRAESAPGLWANAQLELREPGPVIERLDELADPSARRSDLSVPFAAALVATEHYEQAATYLRSARRQMPGVHDLTHLHAQVLIQQDDPHTAIMALEGVVGPACAGGTCRPAAMHVPSLRLLVDLHREHGTPAKADELAVYLGQMTDRVADTGALQPDRSATVI